MISSLTIHGFKSYKEKTTILFNEKLNVVIGRNGSGKSNLFHAITFLLQDNPRQDVINGISAQVQITLKNLPISSIKRTIGMYKDEYQVDNKAVTKEQVKNMLESVLGNYYIVPQGKIQTICTYSPVELLDIIKQVAGTSVYEQKRTESLAIFTETNDKQSQIIALLGFIDDRLKELQEEKKELQKFLMLDSKRRCLEYALFNKQQQESNNSLMDVEEEIEDQKSLLENGELEIKDREILVEEKRKEIYNFELEKKDCQERINDLKELMTEKKNYKTKISLELENISFLEVEEVDLSCQNDLEKINSSIQEIEIEEQQIMQQRENLLERQDQLNEKRRFTSKAQRDGRFNEMISDLDVQIHETSEYIEQTRKEKETREKQLKTDEMDVDIVVPTGPAARKEKEMIRKELWRKEAKLNSLLSQAKEEKQSILLKLGIKDHGTMVFDLFDIEEIYDMAIDSIAGRSLFNIVVENEKEALDLIGETNSRHTFMPLSRLSYTSRTFPSKDCIPVISRLKFDKKYQSVMENIFGRAVICPTLHHCAEMAKNHKAVGVTVGGDVVEAQGAISGGYRKQNRMTSIRILKEAKKNIANLNEELKKVGLELREVESAILELRDEERTAERQKYLQDERLKEQQRVQTENQMIRQFIKEAENEIKSATASLQELQAKKNGIISDLRLPFHPISQRELRELNAIPKELEALAQKLEELAESKLPLELEKITLEGKLAVALEKQKEYENSINHNKQSHELKANLEISMQTVEAELDNWQKRVDNEEQKLSDLFTEIDSGQRTLEKKLTELQQLATHLENIQHSMTKLTSKLQLLNSKKQHSSERIRQLGVLPDEFKKYEEMATSALLSALHTTQKELQKYESVNKKSLEQYDSFVKQKQQLRSRKIELEKSRKAITKLVKELDRKKDEAVEKVFQDVCRHFSEIWTEIVGGEGTINLLEKEGYEEVVSSGESEDDNDTESALRSQLPDRTKYQGMELHVSFKAGEKTVMSQLSGGQKSMVALCLIFAIQKCDPAPFYLFDEVDAALDPAYRVKVAEMIKILSESTETQFIITTFRPELLKHGDKFIGVSFGGKVSTVREISREEAKEFVQAHE